MDTDRLESVYFEGIGGIGMSALARYFAGMGVKISGYDRTPTPLTDELISEGMSIHFEERPDLIPDDTGLVIYTPAIPSSNTELKHVVERNLPLRKRSEVLGMISDKGRTIALAGTHGKTTTSTLVAHILKSAGTEFFAFLGGISKNYSSNFINSRPGQRITSSAWIVAEADEFDRSFLHLHPSIAVITSADADHLDVYGSAADMNQTYRQFTGNVRPGGALIMKKGVNVVPLRGDETEVFSYAVDEPADYRAINIKVNNGHYLFDLQVPSGIIKDFSTGIPGRFNLENSITALAVAHRVGIGETVMKNSLSTFTGVRRRFDFHIRRPDFVFLDDYAHHPEELKASISAVKEVYPGKRITGVFQPHLYSRTRDFADSFAASLGLLDEVILLDIYPAREEPVEGITSGWLLNKIRSGNKMLCRKDQLVGELLQRRPEVLITLGAGDIDTMIEPIKKAFEKTER